MRFEFGPTITRRPATKAVLLPSGLVKAGTASGTTRSGMTIPDEPARGPGSGGRLYAPCSPLDGLGCVDDVLRADPTCRQPVHCPARRRRKGWPARQL